MDVSANDGQPGKQTLDRGQPTVAFIDVDHSARGALLETELLGQDSVRWLERNQVDDVLREHKLTTLFGASSVAERASLGKLLKADLLVLLREHKEPKPHLSLVVCETNSGLRLCVESQPLTDKPEADIASVKQAALRGIQRHGENIREVCAIPPFVSHDLTREHDHLKAAYATLIQQALLRMPEVLVVELEEAQAVAKELILVGRTAKRPLPLYVLGEYRNTGQGDARTSRISVKIKRGEGELAAVEKSGLSPADSTNFVRADCVASIQTLVGQKSQPSDPDLEAGQLTDRAQLFLQLGEWSEALALLEASLLLKPRQERVHHDAVVALTELTIRNWRYGTRSGADPRLGLTFYRRGLEHTELFLSVADDLQKYPTAIPGAHFLHRSRGALNGFFRQPAMPKELLPVAEETLEYRRDILVKEVKRRERLRTTESLNSFLFSWALDDATERQRSQLIFDTLAELQHVPGSAARVRRFSHRGYSIERLDSPEGRELLVKLTNVEDEATRATASSMLQELETFLAAKKSPPKVSPTVSKLDRKLVEFRPLKLTARSLEGRPLPLPKLNGLTPAGRGIDVAWEGGSVFLMKSKDRWDEALLLPDNAQVTHVTFDGKFVWVSGNGVNGPLLRVMDPVSERVWPITSEDGLPTDDRDKDPKIFHKLSVAGLSPGRALLVGYFGRTWIGTAQFSESKGFSLKIFHEAREYPDPENKQQGQSTTVAFTPTFTFTLREDVPATKPPRCCVLVGRSTPNTGQADVTEHPLAVNPDDETVVVHSDRLWGEAAAHQLTCHQGVLYSVVATPPSGDELKLVRIRFPGTKQETFLSDPREGFLLFLKDRVHVAGNSWWDQSLATGTVRPLHDQVPWTFWPRWGASDKHLPPNDTRYRNLRPEEAELKFAGLSQHYGMLAVTTNQQRGTEFFQIIPSDGPLSITKTNHERQSPK